VKLPTPDYGPLLPAIHEQLVEKNLQPKEDFVRAVIQLYETVLVRHGLMVVGECMSGKTNVFHVLADAMSSIKDHPDYVKTHIHTINPKAVSMGQLYGTFDESTHEWEDGILAVIFRKCAKSLPATDRHWMLFDGPVDSLWIESMNTVLDDNKKLCLSSGEIVKMSGTMTMMFEPQDLDAASPATVSRVGMVYMEQVRLGWEPLLKSWLALLPECIKESQSPVIDGLFRWLIPPLLFFVRRGGIRVPQPITDLELVGSLLRLLRCLMHETFFVEKVVAKKENFERIIEGYFIQAIAWSLGVVTDTAGRQQFDEALRRIVGGRTSRDTVYNQYLHKDPVYAEFVKALPVRSRAYEMPGKDNSIYDQFFNGRTIKWDNWMSMGGEYRVPRDAVFNQILVPTIDTIRNGWTIDLLIQHKCHVLCTGPTGTGKSVGLVKKLMTQMDDSYMPLFLNFSAQTGSNQTQDIIDGKLTKRRKGIYGPPLGKRAIIFVDDLNMPAPESWGAQPPIEVLRQWMCQSGWYNRKECTFRKLVDIQFVAAMGPPGGGRTYITQRYVRHFNMLGFVPFDTTSLKRIFSTIMEWALSGYQGRVIKLRDPLVAATIDIYNTIERELLPTPAKSHYTFNLRDLSKVFQGVCNGSPDKIQDPEALVRLWAHECLRVFHDRLVDTTDRSWFHRTLAAKVQEHFRMNWTAIRGPEESVIFGDFSDPRATKKVYQELADREQLFKVMQTYLEDYNAINTQPMNLVLFLNAIEHISRISRIINQPLGNALLVGVGGSGRKSLTRMAVFIADFTVFSIEISKTYNLQAWRDDLRRLLRVAGEDGKQTVFLFNDTQIVMETFVEDINNILNTGEVPNLYDTDEKMMILESMERVLKSQGAKQSDQTEQYSLFVERCRTNLHVVLTFSPIGDAFRERLRMFPSLVNCCTIDWFLEWPADALKAVGQHFFREVELPGEVREGVIELCVTMQDSVSALTKQYLDELRRFYYVTPTSYLELLSTFKALIGEKRREVVESKSRYENGLSKLKKTADSVAIMKTELIELQPKLKVAKGEAEAMLVKIEQMQVVANEKAEIISKEEAICATQAAEAQALKSECEAALAEAIPALEAAIKALRTLTSADIVEVKAMKRPPGGVKITLEAVCMMMRVKPNKVPAPDGRSKMDDYWIPAQKNLLNDTKFLQKLMDYDKDNISDDILNKVEPYTKRDDFTPEVILKSSKAAAGLCKWVHAMVVYNRVSKIVKPKRESLKLATAQLEEAEGVLAGKRAELAEATERIEALQRELADTMARKEDLQAQVDKCETQLNRAEKLLSGLSGERGRWGDFVVSLGKAYENLLGDVLLSSGVVAYLGPFTRQYREQCLSKWADLLTARRIPSSPSFSLQETLGEPVVIQGWLVSKLPNDGLSISNAIMMVKSNRFPLCIDPQGQANKWIRNMEVDNKLQVTKQHHTSFVRTIENAVSFGRPVLLENLPESIDPVLESVLEKAIVRVGTQATIRVGDSQVDYDPNFRLYMTTKLSNPHYPPETCVRVNLLNFMATEDGLEDQLMAVVVKAEMPELEAQREQLVEQDASNKLELKKIEDTILKLLAESEGNILDDEVLIQTLAKSKTTSNTIMDQVKLAEKTTIKIDNARLSYKPVAARASKLFFCITDLATVDPMYQYSLEWYVNLFLLGIQQADKHPVRSKERLAALMETFTYILYKNVCRSLFERHKLLFSFLLCTKLQLTSGALSLNVLRFFLQGSVAMDLERPNPCAKCTPQWLSDKAWADLIELSKVEGFAGFADTIASQLPAWEQVYLSSDPGVEVAKLVPRFTTFQQLCVLRCIRPDKVVHHVMAYVEEEMDKKFIDPPVFDLDGAFQDSNCCSPLIFVLSSGADPMTELLKLAERHGMGRKLFSVSLGQGQGPIAENAISLAVDKGTWVCLQNCHLAESWMPTLERICEEITPERTNGDFRLWLTSMPSPKFPPSVLQNGVKQTMEPPKGLRSGLLGSYNSVDPTWFESCKKPRAFKRLLFGLCFFHSTMRERRKFGPLGWNIPYAFSEPDLRITMDQLKLFLDGYDEINYDALAYLAGECNYGGRVTDDKDRRTLLCILSDFYTPDILKEDYTFSTSGVYRPPPEGPLRDYVEYIKGLPFSDGPDVFGMHDNADIACAISETNILLDTALSLQPRSSGGSGDTWEDRLTNLATEITSRLPSSFDGERVAIDYPVIYDNSMNTVLQQELMRFNKLIEKMQSSLSQITKAIKGLVVMSRELEDMGNSMVNGWVPDMWKAVSYPSLKPLGSWVTDLLKRLKLFSDWISDGQPDVYWISGFFFTQSFLTGTRQNYARKYTIPIDEISFDFKVLSPAECEAVKGPAPDGAYVQGLFLEGAAWDSKNLVMCESRPKELYVSMPILWMIPKESKLIDLTTHQYDCPTYKTSLRRGVLSTTGHSTNFVMMVRIPMSRDDTEKYWVKRGVAMLTQLDD
jgi:dynein heavy chain